MRRPLPLLLASLCWLTGCGDLVLIGSRCTDGVLQCAEGSPGDATDDAGDAGDGSVPDAGPSDGEMEDAPVAPEDAEPPDAGPGDATADAPEEAAVFEPLLRNRSFELTAGEPGNLDDTASGTKIAPWNRCPDFFEGLQGVSVVESALLGQVTPTEPEDGTLLALTYSLGSGFALLAQRLETPWPAGQTRALTFDVDGQGVLDRLRLSFLGSAEECPQPEARELLASSLDVDRRLGWERDVCLEITPDQDVQWFLLTAEASLPPVLDAGIVIGQVFVDNIRESERCP